MVRQQSRVNDPTDPWSQGSEGGGEGRGAGTLLMAALVGVGIGLLAAPQPGTRTRKVLLKRLAELGEGVGESLEDVQDVGSRARKRVKRRMAKLRQDAVDEWESVPERWSKTRSRVRDQESSEEEDSGSFGKLFALAAGLATTYFMTSERTASARGRVQETAADVGRRATDRWERFQRGGIGPRNESNESRSETRVASGSSSEAPQAS